MKKKNRGKKDRGAPCDSPGQGGGGVERIWGSRGVAVAVVGRGDGEGGEVNLAKSRCCA
jgi:hypothetical protein